MTIHITPAIEQAYKAYLDEVIDCDFNGSRIRRLDTYPYVGQDSIGIVGFAAGYQAALDDLRQDAKRLDFLDRQGEAYGVHEHEGNRWLIEGPFKSLRVAIDKALAVQPSNEGTR